MKSLRIFNLELKKNCIFVTHVLQIGVYLSTLIAFSNRNAFSR